MTDLISVFMTHFLISALLISAITGILLLAKFLLRNVLSDHAQYRLWLLWLGLLAVPFLPFRSEKISVAISFLSESDVRGGHGSVLRSDAVHGFFDASDALKDFSLSVTRKASPTFLLFLFGIWIIGVIIMFFSVIRAGRYLHVLKMSSSPVLDDEIQTIYEQCLSELSIKRGASFLSLHAFPRRTPALFYTDLLTSPVMFGIIKPCICLPSCLSVDLHPVDMRHILLHELQHYKRRDALTGIFMSFTNVLYWFHPIVRYALKKMRDDRELACDASVLQTLKEDEYESYGHTLINFARMQSHVTFSFVAGMSSRANHLKKRITHIASYHVPTRRKRFREMTVFSLITVLLACSVPMLSLSSADGNDYEWEASSETISVVDLTSYFHGYEGSFVLYDLNNDSWQIHNIESSVRRVSPNSTYKIYDALFALEEGVITPQNSRLSWDGTTYPFDEWNGDQNLSSALHSSVNWYFQSLDAKLGAPVVKGYLQKIGYGNKKMSGDLSSYWLESSLRISPVEQVQLLTGFYQNDFGFSSENIRTVKHAICIFSSENARLYGKTGTGRVNGKDVSGWFVGFFETNENTYFFATNIQSIDGATGSNAAEITHKILKNLLT